MLVTWDGWYRDGGGQEAISIENDGSTLRMVIRGVEFSGGDFDDLVPSTELPEGAPFTLSGGALCGCELRWVVPVPVVHRGGIVDGWLEFHLALGAPREFPPGGIDAEDLTATLRYGEASHATTRPAGDFEGALEDIHQQLPPGVYVKCCVTCAWSDYSPAGTGLFGYLACFRDNKDAYRRVTTKRELFAIWKTQTEAVQETYLCGEFERRGEGAGYRGSFPCRPRPGTHPIPGW